MRLSAFFSLAAHVGVVVAGVLSWQEQASTPEMATPMIVIPLELMTIGDVTDIAPIVEAKTVDEAASAEEAEPIYAAAAAPAPEDDTVNLETPVTPPKKEEAVKKPEAAPAPAKKKDEDLNSFLDSMLTDVKKDKPKATPAPAGRTATTETGAPRMGAGEMRKTQVTVGDYIKAQLINKKCWTDHSDMADAQRLTATIRVWFGRDGKFARPPELQTREPFGDPPMQVFIQHARTALSKCNTLGWQVPEEYFKLQPAPYYIDLVFVPKVGA